MSLIRESLTPAPSDASTDAPPPVDAFAKARAVIAATEGLTADEKERVTRSFQDQLGDAQFPDFLAIFAKRAAQEAVRKKTRLQSSTAPTTEVPVATNGNKVEVTVPQKRGLLFWRRPK